MTKEILVGARKSPLAQAQVKEILYEIRLFRPEIHFHCLFVDTHGDLDLKTSLRDLSKTDFFTREVDRLLCEGKCRVGVHSAKDLPEPLMKGIDIAAITMGRDPADSLVLRAGETLASLPGGAKIATSSVRREDAVRQLRADLNFMDLRGTIGDRLAKLENGEADGVVIAEAAIIRLELTHLNRIRLPGETVKYQGQLAVAVKEGDREMMSLFSCLDVRHSS